MRLSEALGRKVVGVDDATTLGTVSGFVVRPDEPQLAALRLRRPGGRGTVLPWARVRAVGTDAVMAQASAGSGESEAEEGGDGRVLSKHAVKHGEVLGKRVLTELGDELGEVTDVDFDPESGALLSVLVGEESLDAGRMRGLGSYALVLRAG